MSDPSAGGARPAPAASPSAFAAPAVQRLIPALLYLLVAAAAFLVHAGGLGNEFVWDDPIVLNQQIHAFHSLHDIFFPPPHIPQFGQLYYRPLIILSYVADQWLDRRLWNDPALAFHVSVILFHVLNSGLVFLVGRTLFGTLKGATAAATAGALLFATHPIHTESVYWMAGRSDTLAALFLLPGICVYLLWKRDRSRWRSLVLVAALFLIGCFAKESALGLLMIVVAADLLGVGEKDPMPHPRGAPDGPNTARLRIDGRRSRKGGRETTGDARLRSGRSPGKARSGSESALPRVSAGEGSVVVSRIGLALPGWLALGIAAGIYFSMRSAALAKEGSPLVMQNPDLLASIANLFRAVGFYLIKVLVPTHLDAYIPEIPNPGLSLAAGLLGLAGVGALGVWTWRRGETFVPFFIAWFFGALAPSLAIAFFQISEAPVAERYLYLPSAGFCLLVAYLLFVKLPSVLPAVSRWALAAAAGTVIVVVTGLYAWSSVERGAVWRTDLDFWKDAVAKSPDEGLPHLHLGLAYANKDQTDLAEREYNLALTSKYDVEGRSIVYNDLGMLYIGRGGEDRAESYFQESIKLRPEYATPHYGIGMASFRNAEKARARGDGAEVSRLVQQSERFLRKAIDLNPQYVKAHSMLGQVLAATGRSDEALPHVERVLALVKSGREYEVSARLRERILQARRNGAEPAAGGASPTGPGR